MGLKFPINRRFEKCDSLGLRYIGSVEIEQTNDANKYPPVGVKMTAKLIRIN